MMNPTRRRKTIETTAITASRRRNRLVPSLDGIESRQLLGYVVTNTNDAETSLRNAASGWPSRSDFFRPNRIVKGRKPGRRRGWRHFRPLVTGLEDRRLLSNYDLTTLASFNGTNGDAPYAGLVMDGQGNLYGTTDYGGASGYGAVYEVANGSNSITSLASFNGADGSYPSGGLVMDGQGNLYGTASSGGANGDGTVFEVANGSNSVTTLASLNGADGFSPVEAPVLNSQGDLYGTARYGGAKGDGTVFEVANGSNSITNFASFNGTNGDAPYAGLVMDGQGNLYGTTRYGGASGEGAVFEIANGSNAITNLASFNGSNGMYPEGSLILDGQGNLYGTAEYGGASGDGAVFEIANGSNTITNLASFNGNNGMSPEAGLVMDGQGNLYGTTVIGGASGDGTVFEIASGSNTITTLASFSGANGAYSEAGLVLDGQGNLYGTTTAGGAMGDGAVFELTPGATQLMVTTQPPPIVGLDDTFDVQISAEDSSGDVDTSFSGSVTVALDNNPGGATLGGTLTVNAVNGVADFSDLTLNEAGNGYALLATSASLTSVDTASFSVAYIVTNTSDSGPGSLRQAILNADANDSVPNTIAFNIPETDPGFANGVFTIQPQSDLPILLDNITIDGTTQTKFTGDTNPLGPEVVLNGSLDSGGTRSGLRLDDNNTVEGLVVDGFAWDGISLNWYTTYHTAMNNAVLNNYIGTDPTGTSAVPNMTGINLTGFGSPDQQAANNVFQGNLISGNLGSGIGGGDFRNTQILDNMIGTERDGVSPLGNGGSGVVFAGAGAPRNLVQGNIIAYNGGDGIFDSPDYNYISIVDSPDGHQSNAFLQNSIFSNGKLGIDLRAQGATQGVPLQNTPGGPHQGPNLLQNNPVLASAVSGASSTVITGTFNSTPSESFDLEFFASPTANASGYGEGETYLGDTSVTTDASGNASFTVTVPVGNLEGQVLSATATDPGNNTSEFSADIPITATPTFSGLTPSQSIAYGTPSVTLGGTLAAGSTPATGDVSITLNNVTQTAALQADGSFSSVFNTAALAVAGSPYTVTYSYAATTYFNAASDSSTSVTVNNVTATALSASTAVADQGQLVTFTATVSDLTAGGATPSGGTVTFSDQNGTLDSESLVDGVATFTTTSLAAGTYTVTASYSGTADFAPSTTGTIVTAAGNGTSGYSGDNGPAIAAELDYPGGVAVDAAGDLFIADTNNNVIREVVKATADIITVAGNGISGYSGDNGPATDAELDYPGGVAVDSAGDLFIADTNNNVIREVVKATGDIITVAGNGIPGYSGDNGPATASELNRPFGVAVDAAGDLFIADTFNNVIREVVNATGNIITVAGNDTQGYSGDNGPATAAELNDPAGVAVDATGDLFIADAGNNVIREVVSATGNIITVAGTSTYGYSGDNGPATAAELGAPFGVAVDAVGDLFIADTFNNVVREVVNATGDIITVAGSGIIGYSGDNGPATAAELNYPFGVAVDSAGDLFVADEYNSVVRQTTPAVIVTINNVVTNTNDSGPGSLRQAILNADANDSVPNTIVFNIPETDPGYANGVFTIQPLSQLPVVRENITIDGTTQAAFTGNTNPYGPVIVLNGAKQSSGDGLELNDNDTVKDLDINGFQGGGIRLAYSFSSNGYTNNDNQILDNYVGTDPTGTIAVPNGYGVAIIGWGSPYWQSTGNLIQGNLISGNLSAGIAIGDTNQTQIIGNLIGTDRTGTANLGNGGNGIQLSGAGAPSNTIEGNTIAFNADDGIVDSPDYRYSVAYTPSGHQGNAFLQNSIFSNGMLGIDLRAPGTDGNIDAPQGVPLQNTPGGPHQGANLLQNYPVLNSAISSTGNTVITGSLNSTPGETFHLEFFASPTANASGYGEGKTYLGDTSVTTDASGNASFTVTVPVGNLEGQVLSATATDPGNNTSEFSADIPVTATPTFTGLTPSQSIAYGIPSVTLGGTLEAGSTPATGNVSITLNNVTQTAALQADGSFTSVFNTAALAVAGSPYTVTYTYAATTYFNAASDSSTSVTVNEDVTTSSITSSVNPSVFGQSVTVTATVDNISGSGGVPTGTVTFMDSSTALSTVQLIGGQATFTTEGLPAGSDAITAVYNGSSTAAPSTSAVLTETVNQDETTTTLTSTPNPSVYGQTVTFTATMTAVAPGSGTPTGTVTFMDGSTTIGSATLNSGKATLKTDALAVGTQSITAVYSGDENFLASTSAALNQTVKQDATTTRIKSSSNPSVVGQEVTFTATVTASAPGSGVPTGTVTFMDGSTTLGSGVLSGGIASYATSSLSVGTHLITAVYSGDTDFKTSTSRVLVQRVNNGPSVRPAVSTASLVDQVLGTLYEQDQASNGSVVDDLAAALISGPIKHRPKASSAIS